MVLNREIMLFMGRLSNCAELLSPPLLVNICPPPIIAFNLLISSTLRRLQACHVARKTFFSPPSMKELSSRDFRA